MTPAPLNDPQLDRLLGAYDAPAPSAGFAARVAAEAVRTGRVQPLPPPSRPGAGRRPWVRRRMVAGLVFLNLLAASALAAAIGGHPFEFGRLAAMTQAFISPHHAAPSSSSHSPAQPPAARRVAPAEHPAVEAPPLEAPPLEAARAPVPLIAHPLPVRPIVARTRPTPVERRLAMAHPRLAEAHRPAFAHPHRLQLAQHERRERATARMAERPDRLRSPTPLAARARADPPRADPQSAQPARLESAAADARPTDALAQNNRAPFQARRDEMRQRRAQWRAARFANPNATPARTANGDGPARGQQRWRNGWRRGAGRLGRRGA